MTTLRAERGHGTKGRAFIAERSTSILDQVAIEIRAEKDQELADLLADTRAAVEQLILDAP